MATPYNVDADYHLRALGFVSNRYLGEWVGGDGEAPTWCPPYEEYCDITDCETVIIDENGRVVSWYENDRDDSRFFIAEQD